VGVEVGLLVRLDAGMGVVVAAVELSVLSFVMATEIVAELLSVAGSVKVQFSFNAIVASSSVSSFLTSSV